MSSKSVYETTVQSEMADVVVPELRFPEFRDSDRWALHFGNVVFSQINTKRNNIELPVLAITQEHGAIPRDMIDYHVSVTESSLINYKVVEKGDFIISLRSFQGGIEYSKHHGICSPAYVVLRMNSPLCSDFFRHYFKSSPFIRSLNTRIEGLRDGKMVSFAQFSKLRLPMPSAAEQRRVADCLSSIDALIAAEAAKLEALKDHKKGLMQQLFPAPGQTAPRLRFPEFRGAADWIVQPLGEIFETASGGTPERKTKEYWGGDIPWVTTSMVDSNIIVNADQFITTLGLQNSSAKLFPKNTVLIAMYGQGKTRGKAAILGIEAATNQACAAILPKEGIDPNYVFLNLVSRYDELRMLSNSGGQENLSQGLVCALPFSYPENIAEQERISTFLSSIDALIDAQDDKIDALKVHKQGLMQQLFPVADQVQA